MTHPRHDSRNRPMEFDDAPVWSPGWLSPGPGPSYQETGIRAEEAARGIGGAQPLPPAPRVLPADGPRPRETPDGREEAIEPIGHVQLPEHQGPRGRDDLAEAGLQEERDESPADPARGE